MCYELVRTSGHLHPCLTSNIEVCPGLKKFIGPKVFELQHLKKVLNNPSSIMFSPFEPSGLILNHWLINQLLMNVASIFCKNTINLLLTCLQSICEHVFKYIRNMHSRCENVCTYIVNVPSNMIFLNDILFSRII